MKKRWLCVAGLILVGISLAFGLSYFLSSFLSSGKREAAVSYPIGSWNPSTVVRSSSVPTRAFLDRRTFEAAWKTYGQIRSKRSSCTHDRVGIVNHHVLAIDLMVHFFDEAQRCRPDVMRVIVLSPDHYLAGTTAVTSFKDGYEVFGESLKIDKPSVDALLLSVPPTRLSKPLFVQEHGSGALVPFVARVWPKAKVVPVALRSDLDRATAKRVVFWLKEELKDPQTFLIVSSDMSHYLDERTALRNDQETRRAFMAGDEEFFWRADDRHTDNGKAIWIALRALGNGSQWEESDHAISTKYGGSPGFTTTYITGFWR